MKVHNAVIGMKVQVKRDCRGYCGEFIKKGLVCSIKWVDVEDGEGYELSLVHPDIDDRFAWVNASDVRRYTKPAEPLTKGTRVKVKSTLVGKWGEKLQEGDIYILQGDEDISFDGAHRRIDVKAVNGSSSWSTQPKYFNVLPDEVPDEPQDDIQVGDSVLVGTEGAGNQLVLKEYTGLVCSVVDTSHRDDCVEILHPSVNRGVRYTSLKKYLTKVTPKPTESPKPVIVEDDIVELREDCTAKHGELIPKGLYIVGCTDKFDDTCTVLTVHGGFGQASLPMAKVHKVGVCNATNG